MNESLENEEETSIIDAFLHLSIADVLDYAAFVTCLGSLTFWLIVICG